MNDPRLRSLSEKIINLALGKTPPLHTDPVVYDLEELCDVSLATPATTAWLSENRDSLHFFLLGLYALRPGGALAGGATDRGPQFPFQIGKALYTNSWKLAAQKMLEKIVSTHSWPKPPRPAQLEPSGIHQFITTVRAAQNMLQPGTAAHIRLQIVLDMLEFISAPHVVSLYKFVRVAAAFQTFGLDCEPAISAVNILLALLYLDAREYSDNRYAIAAALDAFHENKCSSALMRVTWQGSKEPPDLLITGIKQSIFRIIEEARLDITEHRSKQPAPALSETNPIKKLYHPAGTFAFPVSTTDDSVSALARACRECQIPLELLSL